MNSGSRRQREFLRNVSASGGMMTHTGRRVLPYRHIAGATSSTQNQQQNNNRPTPPAHLYAEFMGSEIDAQSNFGGPGDDDERDESLPNEMNETGKSAERTEMLKKELLQLFPDALHMDVITYSEEHKEFALYNLDETLNEIDMIKAESVQQNAQISQLSEHVSDLLTDNQQLVSHLQNGNRNIEERMDNLEKTIATQLASIRAELLGGSGSARPSSSSSSSTNVVATNNTNNSRENGNNKAAALEALKAKDPLKNGTLTATSKIEKAMKGFQQK